MKRYVFLLVFCLITSLLLTVQGTYSKTESPTPTPDPLSTIILLTESEEYAESTGASDQIPIPRAPVTTHTSRSLIRKPPVLPTSFPEPTATPDTFIEEISIPTEMPELATELPPVTQIESDPVESDMAVTASEIIEQSQQPPVQPEPTKLPQKKQQDDDPLSYINKNKERFAKLLQKQSRSSNKRSSRNDLKNFFNEFDQAIAGQISDEYEIVRIKFDPRVYELENLSYETGKEAEKLVQRSLSLIEVLPDSSRIFVLGYADDYPETAKNHALAEKRARQIQAELVARLFTVRVPFPDIVFKSVAKAKLEPSQDSDGYKYVEILIPR